MILWFYSLILLAQAMCCSRNRLSSPPKERHFPGTSLFPWHIAAQQLVCIASLGNCRRAVHKYSYDNTSPAKGLYRLLIPVFNWGHPSWPPKGKPQRKRWLTPGPPGASPIPGHVQTWLQVYWKADTWLLTSNHSFFTPSDMSAEQLCQKHN